jgi:hypothetical protein
MVFFFGCIFLVFMGRKVGWMLSRRFLYSHGAIASGYMCLLWGASVACVLQLMMLGTGPGLLLKLFGYWAGLYVATPNYGLLAVNTIPPEMMPRNTMIGALPKVSFIAISILFAVTTVLN